MWLNNLFQSVFKLLQLVLHLHQLLKNLCTLVNTVTVGAYDFPCGGNLEAAHLHKIVYVAQFLDVLLRVLPYIVGCGTGLQIRELRLPVAER